jgi:hypothetical protein
MVQQTQNNFMESIRSIGGRGANLGNKDEITFGLTDATTSIIANETKTSDAGGANLAMQTRSVRNPFQWFGADSTTIIHVFFFFSSNPNFNAQIKSRTIVIAIRGRMNEFLGFEID